MCILCLLFFCFVYHIYGLVPEIKLVTDWFFLVVSLRTLGSFLYCIAMLYRPYHYASRNKEVRRWRGTWPTVLIFCIPASSKVVASRWSSCDSWACWPVDPVRSWHVVQLLATNWGRAASVVLSTCRRGNKLTTYTHTIQQDITTF